MKEMYVRSALGLLLAVAVLTGCSGSSSDAPSPGGGQVTPPDTSCAEPAPAGTMDATVTVNIPSDFDPTANPVPTTAVPFTVLMPQRCPGEVFPVVLYSHGFSGSRIKTIGNDTTLIDDDNAKPLLDRGYVVISLDQRGHGDNRPGQDGGYARVMDPLAETQDARAILDWAYEHAADIAVQTEPGSGIAKDLKVGTLGGSYGGGFQFPLVALDPRIDVIAPDRTWHDLLYSLLPGDAVKTWARLFATVVQLDQLQEGQGVTGTPLLRTLANQVGPLGPNANLVRTRDDFFTFAAAPTAQPRPVTEEEAVSFIYTHGPDYLESQQAAGQPWGFGETQAKLRPVPALFTQGNRDVLFNVTEAYWNARYFAATGADVRLLTHEDGHMNPLADQARGVWACGKHDAQAAILAWFDRYLKGLDSATFQAIPKVCISVVDTADAATAAPVGVTLSAFPVGSLSGAGAVPAAMPTLNASVTPATDTNGLFVPIVTIQGNDKVLAGIPRIGKIAVTPGTGSVQTAIALVGVAIKRGGETLLVDDQVTAFVAGEHDGNRGVAHPGELLLPGVGERLQDGDQVGLLFFQHHKQYAPIVSAQNVGVVGQLPVPGLGAISPVLSALDPASGLLVVPNPYEVTATDVGLPILVPGQYPGSSLSQ